MHPYVCLCVFVCASLCIYVSCVSACVRVCTHKSLCVVSVYVRVHACTLMTNFPKPFEYTKYQNTKSLIKPLAHFYQS